MSAEERTGWRDQEISARHRTWGTNCPAVDLDFLMVEYNAGLPVALVEYKHHLARRVDLRHATYRAIGGLAAAADIPFVLVYYWPDIWAFWVYPVNSMARRIYPSGRQALSEQRFVRSLYYMRRQALDRHVYARLETAPLPPDAALPEVIGWIDERDEP